MPIESKCPNCGRMLRVADEHAGLKARCPACNVIYQVGEAGSEAPRTAMAEWRLRTPEGQIYGPVDKAEMDQWVVEGRVTADCQLSTDYSGWQDADRCYPVLREIPAPVTAESAGDEPQGTRNPYASPTGRPSEPRYRYTSPHRGAVVLTLGILSWMVGCPIFGLIAWIMGSTDLREMRLGRMDPSGQGLTQAGQIIGMIHALLVVVVLVIAFGLLLVSVAVR